MRNIIKSLLVVFLLGGLLLFASYYKSKSTALELVGETLHYFPLSRARVILESAEENKILWMFKFSFPDSYDEDLYVYTTLFGDLNSTTPKGLGDMLRCFERQEYHPYSKTGIEKAIQRVKEGKTTQRLCR